MTSGTTSASSGLSPPSLGMGNNQSDHLPSLFQRVEFSSDVLTFHVNNTLLVDLQQLVSLRQTAILQPLHEKMHD